MTTPSSKRGATNLIALGSTAVLVIYAAGYLRTRSAAQRFASRDAERRPAPPAADRVPVPRSATTAVASAPATKPAAQRAEPTLSSPSVAPPAKKTTTAASTPPPVADSTLVASNAPAAVPTPPPSSGGSGTGTITPPADSTANPADTLRAKYKDGTYSGWGTSRHGDIQAAVEIKGGRIISAYITQCLTRYSCSRIDMLPPQIVSRQSPECDYVSGATQSTNAFYYAIVDALSKAK